MRLIRTILKYKGPCWLVDLRICGEVLLVRCLTVSMDDVVSFFQVWDLSAPRMANPVSNRLEHAHEVYVLLLIFGRIRHGVLV